MFAACHKIKKLPKMCASAISEHCFRRKMSQQLSLFPTGILLFLNSSFYLFFWMKLRHKRGMINSRSLRDSETKRWTVVGTCPPVPTSGILLPPVHYFCLGPFPASRKSSGSETKEASNGKCQIPRSKIPLHASSASAFLRLWRTARKLVPQTT